MNMHNDDKLNDTGFSGKWDKLSDETQRLMPVQDLSMFPNESSTAISSSSHPSSPKIRDFSHITAWDDCELEIKIIFVREFIIPITKEGGESKVPIPQSIVTELKEIFSYFETNRRNYDKVKIAYENRGLGEDRENSIKLEILLGKNIDNLEKCLKKANISLEEEYNKKMEAEKSTGETSRSEISYPAGGNRLQIPAIQIGQKQRELDNIKKSIEDIRTKIERAQSDQERTTALETLSILADAKVRKKEELERTQRMAQISA